MHIVILRYCPSFIEGDVIKGTHEQIETEINQKKYSYKGGYNIPFGSEVKLLDYRIKKECAADFLRDLCVHNLNPKSNPVKFFDLFKKKQYSNPDHHLRGKTKFIMFVFGLLSKWGFWLKPFDASDKVADKFFPNTFCYNFFLGVIEDPEGDYGEEL